MSNFAVIIDKATREPHVHIDGLQKGQAIGVANDVYKQWRFWYDLGLAVNAVSVVVVPSEALSNIKHSNDIIKHCLYRCGGV